ncbi:2-hydroxymuconate tautomerase [Lactococcus termiticola]|uniref:4-oxalocrotonate tautomerase n=1 Tax=Lactococcus termiticola TaxID=2169526 RepID=A0A2R5HHF8_9LACT|nr:2-hydroxymuconate tautomerase [Lactococcus termiticola]GBG97286.1 4-oxalocrotonate tautomerase [Lactococcus termiticola]
MPYVTIELVEGRTPEQKAIVAKEIAETLMKHANAPKSAIHVIFRDMKPENHYPEGEARK